MTGLAVPKNEVVYIGGGGEPPGKTTIFDSAYSNFGLFSPSSGWTARSIFDGGHKASEALAQQLFQGRNKTMTTKNVTAEIESLKSRIRNGELKRGDQLLITIATHGLPSNPSLKSHSVATTDTSFSLDELVELRDLAEKKGVLLAIADFSCHSGNTLKISSDKTCVISASGEGIAYNFAGDAIGRSFKRGRNLEEAFLRGRQNKTLLAPTAPQISTEAGQKAFELTKVISNSMEEKSEIKSNKVPANSCAWIRSEPIKKLSQQFSAIERSAGIVPYLKMSFGLSESKVAEVAQKFEKAMQEYHNKRVNVERAFQAMKAANKSDCLTVSAELELCGPMTSIEYGYNSLKNKKDKGSLNKNEEVELAAYERYSRSPQYRNWLAVQKAYRTQPDLFEEGTKVAAAEREVYQTLYEHFSKNATKPNPCRSFVL